LSLSDNGPEIPEKLQYKIFDPFFTTKPPAKHTGLGLTQTLAIVHELNGKLNFSSQKDHTTFSVLLPLSSPPP